MSDKYRLVFLAIMLSSLCSWAQNDRLQFIHADTELSQSTAVTMLQDEKGFLWIGTRNGLNRFDGINMVTYYHDEDDSLSLPNNYVRVLFESKDGTLWVGTEGGGVCRYDPNTDSFIRFALDGSDDQLSGRIIYNITEDQDGNLWVGTQNNGLNLIDLRQQEILHFRPNPDDPFSVSASHVTGVVQDKYGKLWISTWGGGLNLYDPNTKRFIQYRNDPKNEESISSNVIRSTYKAPGGNIYWGTENGLNRLVYRENGQYYFKKIDLGVSHSLVVLSVLEDSKGNLWVGTENNGVFMVNAYTKKIVQYDIDPTFEYSLQNNSIWSLLEDRTGIVWVGTFNKGLYKVDESLRKFNSYRHSSYHDNSVSNNSVSAFAEDNKGNIWIGTDGGGLDYWDVKSSRFTHYNESTGANVKNEVLSLQYDSRDNLWVGTWQGGLRVKKKGSKRFENFIIQHPIGDSKGGENIFDILEDSKGRIWIALYRRGLVMYDPSDGSFRGFEHDEADTQSLSTDFVRCLLEDAKGTVWVGTEGGGLNRVVEQNDSFTFQQYLNNPNDANSISSNSVLSMSYDKHGNLWLGTAAGLNQFDVQTQNWTKYGKKDGMPDEVAYAIQIDQEGYVWVSTNRGLSKFNLETRFFQNFDINDGLQAMEFFKNSSYKLSTGELLFGGVEGFNRFDPKKIRDYTEQPQLYVSNFTLSNQPVNAGPESPLRKPINEVKSINLDHDQNDFGFEFALLSFRQSDRNEYAYQLVNYNDRWQEIGNRREANFTNVPSGHYVFKVKATDNNGRWMEREFSVDIHIATPWYAGAMAIFLYFVVGLILILVVLRTILNRERLQSQLKLDQLEISKMQELDEMKSSFFANISHEFRSPLTLILGPLKAMKQLSEYKMNQGQVDVMIRNAESLLNLINQLLELSKLESGKMKIEVEKGNVVEFLKPIVHSFSSLANQKMVNYKILFPRQPIILYFDKEKIEKVMVNLISNALKFTSDFGNIKISLEETEDEVCICVSDSGVGIPREELPFVFNRYYRVKSKMNAKHKGTGIGLSLTKELVEIHGGRIEVISEERKGSTFNVFLKKGKEHFRQENIVDESSQNFDYDKRSEYQLTDDVQKQTVADALDSFEDQLEKLPQILVIEDNEDIRRYIREILEGEYKIIETGDGIEGLEIAMENIPDMIVSDVMLPGINGFEICKKVKSDLRTSHIPVIILTAKASQESEVEGFEVGADYYITKPFEPKLLSLRVRNAFKITNQIREKLLNKETLQIEPTNVKLASKDEEFIHKAVKVVEENMSNSDFYVDDLGKELGMSRMQLYRKLKALVGQSANEFIRSIRLKRAAQLIKQDQLTISEITYQVGFNDLQYFRDCFKKQFGINPSEYSMQSSQVQEKSSLD